MDVLSRVTQRYAGTEGERAMLHAIRERLPEGVESRIEGFVSHLSPAFFFGLHVVLVVLAGLLGFWHPALGAVLCALVTLSLAGEGLGRFALLRGLFPKSPSYNLMVREAADPSLGAVVLSAPMDVPAWRPLRRRWLTWRPLQLVFAAVLIVDTMLLLRTLAEPWGPRTLELYVLALVVLAVTVVAGSVMHRLGEGSDDGGGPAALIELMRRFRELPVPGVDIWYAFTGCGHAHQGGMHAFLTLHDKTLLEPCLVVALDAPARPPLRAAVSEGSLLAQHHRSTGPALVERLRWAAVSVPPIDRGGATDARAALVHGYRALALSGGDGIATPEAADQVADVLENIVRWYGEDLARVADVRPALQELARATEEARAKAKERRRRRSRKGKGEPASGQEEEEPASGAPREQVGDSS
ncbi:MAG: hypothetical protein JRI25_08815 [Deltaproteobacteria bacterium]|nr:hypothetical protein [Deltaproteobacteria bacterium]